MLTIVAAILSSSMVMTEPPPVHTPPDAKTVYMANCRKCHGATGEAAPSMKRMMPKIRNLDAALLNTLTVDEVVQIISKGKGDMKPLGAKLSPEEINAVAQYVFTLAGAKPKAK